MFSEIFLTRISLVVFQKSLTESWKVFEDPSFLWMKRDDVLFDDGCQLDVIALSIQQFQTDKLKFTMW